MLIKEINVKTVLTKTGIKGFDYCLNPYVGCGHACRYCYASFMKRFTDHNESWEDFGRSRSSHYRQISLHESRRETLLHQALTSGRDAKPLPGLNMQHFRGKRRKQISTCSIEGNRLTRLEFIGEGKIL